MASSIVSAAPGIMGAIGGNEEDKVKTSGQNANVSYVDAAPAGEQENKARDSAFAAQQNLDEVLRQFEGSGNMRNLQNLLSEMGRAPTQDRINASNSLAASLFQGQNEQLDQSLEEQRRQFANSAAQMGRSSSDPILAAKLAQEQIRQRRQLGADQGAFAANEAMYGASRMFGQQLTGLQGLSQAAIQNRQAVFSMGSDFANTQMNYRLATARRYGNTNTQNEQVSGGGLKGAMSGGIAGLATSANMAGSMMSMGSDERIKTNIRPTEGHTADALRKLKGYTYVYKDAKYGEGLRVGVMAQDLEKHPLTGLLVQESGEDEVKYVDSQKTIHFLLAAVAELQQQLDRK